MNSKIIKLTKNQLKETEGTAFKYLDIDNDTPNDVGNSQIGVTGKIDSETFGIPITGDKIGNTMSVQGWNRYRAYGNYMNGNIKESDNNNDGVDDFYNHNELDILSDGDNKNNLIKIPKTVDNRLDMLIKSIESLQPKQQAMVVNKLIETIKLENIPYAWAKELMFKIMSKKNINTK